MREPPSWLDPGESVRPLLDALAGERSVSIAGLYAASLSLVVASACRDMDEPILLIAPDPHVAEALRLDLETFLGVAPHAFPAWPRADRGDAPDVDVLVRRARTLSALRPPARIDTEDPILVVTTLAALAQPVPRPEVFEAARLTLCPGEEHVLDVLLEHLAAAGFARVRTVGGPGEMAARGGVLDVWAFDATDPTRIDFFGDEIEGLRRVEPGSQRSGDACDRLDLLVLEPARLREPGDVGTEATLLAYLPDASPLVLVEPQRIVAAATSLSSAGRHHDVRALETALAERRTWLLDDAAGAAGLHAEVGSLDRLQGVALEAASDHAAQVERRSNRRLGERLAEVVSRHDAVHIVRRAVGEQERLERVLAEHLEPELLARVTWHPGSLSKSFVWTATNSAYVAYDDLIDLPLRDRRSQALARRARPVQDHLELRSGGLVVHRHHGIGVFHGMESLTGPEGEGEYLRLGFAEGTDVYVPVHRIDLVQRYVGSGRTPRLSKIGGTTWAKKRKRVERAVESLALDLLAVHAARRERLGPALGPDGPWQQEMEAAFPHPPTPDQVTAIASIKADLQGARPMDRLLCGDVGYGKTEVALRAVFKVLESGRQAAVLVPTKVLAQQHVRTFQRRLAPYPFVVRALTSLERPATQRATLKAMASGSVDLVVGTHRLLSRDVSFGNLGLIVVDEEQRFGVKHKERLKSLRADVDVLSLSATPIPRTLHMALLGIRDISNLTTPPMGRHPIETRVVREADELVAHAIRRERERGGQLFVVNPTIRDLPVVARWLHDLVPELSLETIHGRMDKERVEDRLMRFVRGEIDLLLATTIIESGLDIPNANTIILRDAHRYGLAELHQLRGRVGREHRRAHALLLIPPDQGLKPEARERLKAIEEYSELGAGFRIAMRDLEIRGAGNLLGPQQSGHIAAVGYDLYCRLLADAVAHAQGRRPKRVPLADLGMDLRAGIPASYAEDLREKFHVYRRITALDTPRAVDAYREELADRYGPVPAPVDRLLLAQRVRVVLGALGVARVDAGPRDMVGVVLLCEAVDQSRLLRALPRCRRLNPQRAFLPLPERAATSAEVMLQEVLQVVAAARHAGPSKES